MHAGGFDPAHGLNGAFELAFEGALIVHLVVEIAAGPVGLVEEFEAEAAAVRACLAKQSPGARLSS